MYRHHNPGVDALFEHQMFCLYRIGSFVYVAPSLVLFLPPRWQYVLQDPAAALIGINTSGRTNLPEVFQENLISKKQNTNRPKSTGASEETSPTGQDGRTCEGGEKSSYSHPSIRVPQESPSDICHDLATETQQLLLEREVDTIDELHMR